MLTGDFSQLLTNGFYSGQIAYFNAQNQVVLCHGSVRQQ